MSNFKKITSVIAAASTTTTVLLYGPTSGSTGTTATGATQQPFSVNDRGCVPIFTALTSVGTANPNGAAAISAVTDTAQVVNVAMVLGQAQIAASATSPTFSTVQTEIAALLYLLCNRMSTKKPKISQFA